jgi:hypothetical protein
VLLLLAAPVACLGVLAFVIAAEAGGAVGDARHPALARVLLLYPTELCGAFFGVAIAAASAHTLEGGRPTLRRALRLAVSRRRQVILFAFIAATFFLVLRIAVYPMGTGGYLVGLLLGAIWSVSTLFVKPLIAIRHDEIGIALRNSLVLIRKHLTEVLAGVGLILLVVVVAFVPGFEALKHANLHGPDSASTLGLLPLGIALAFPVVAAGFAVNGVFAVLVSRLRSQSDKGTLALGGSELSTVPRPQNR